MAKSKKYVSPNIVAPILRQSFYFSHTNHNQTKKAHRNGIKKPKRTRTRSLKGVSTLLLHVEVFISLMYPLGCRLMPRFDNLLIPCPFPCIIHLRTQFRRNARHALAGSVRFLQLLATFSDKKSCRTKRVQKQKPLRHNPSSTLMYAYAIILEPPLYTNLIMSMFTYPSNLCINTILQRCKNAATTTTSVEYETV